MKQYRNAVKAAVRDQQAYAQKLVVGAGVIPPILSTAGGIGASYAIAKHYDKKAIEREKANRQQPDENR